MLQTCINDVISDVRSREERLVDTHCSDVVTFNPRSFFQEINLTCSPPLLSLRPLLSLPHGGWFPR